ncbi:hypothetical protein FRACYDRAFT_142012, partial [Fragilariopsis cylindrus CCMP1102]
LGFTAPLIDSISTFKAKFQNWAECEKSKADLRAESYRNSLIQEQAVIDSKLIELIDIQQEMGTTEKNDNSSNTVEGKEDITSRKKILEEKSAGVQIEILKLKTERDNRDKRVQDIALEESKQRIRANDASSLKRMAEESKKTTIDDLTRGIVSYKKLGLDFTQTGRDAGLEFSFTQLDPVDPSRKFSFVFLVNDEEKYDIIECKPNIDDNVLADILEELNGTDREDMSMLVRCMR